MRVQQLQQARFEEIQAGEGVKTVLRAGLRRTVCAFVRLGVDSLIG